MSPSGDASGSLVDRIRAVLEPKSPRPNAEVIDLIAARSIAAAFRGKPKALAGIAQQALELRLMPHKSGLAYPEDRARTFVATQLTQRGIDNPETGRACTIALLALCLGCRKKEARTAFARAAFPNPDGAIQSAVLDTFGNWTNPRVLSGRKLFQSTRDLRADPISGAVYQVTQKPFHPVIEEDEAQMSALLLGGGELRQPTVRGMTKRLDSMLVALEQRSNPPKNQSSLPTSWDALDWEEIEIRGSTDGSLAVSARGEAIELNAVDVGFGDARTPGRLSLGKWRAMLVLIRAMGELDWTSREANRSLRHNIPRAGRVLQRFFGIPTPPFVWERPARGKRGQYRSRVALAPL
jgi:hypothetical protein